MIIDLPQFFKLRSELPLVDVRSENEFQSGHIVGAVNVPILNDSERVIVGTAYKKEGQLEAIKSGFRLVGPRLYEIITASENIGKELIVHCWRGGMRSANYCQFVGMAGIKTHQLNGGYKTYRQHALASFKTPYQLNVLSGFTGSGKSDVLRQLKSMGEQVVDLEALARHKGSVFGGLGMQPQPTTEQFQNDLFEELIKLDPARRIWIEDESIALGKIFLPKDFWITMGRSFIVELVVPREVRVQRLVDEYGQADKSEFIQCLKGITKKLGGQHYNAAAEKVKIGDMHTAIDIILNYYDKAYANSLERKKDRIKVSESWNGNNIDVLARELVNKAGRISLQDQILIN